MACYCSNDRLLLELEPQVLSKELPDFDAALESIHEWHVAVNQYEVDLPVLPSLLRLHILLDDVEGINAIESLEEVIGIDIELELEDCLESVDVEDLVVNYQYLF